MYVNIERAIYIFKRARVNLFPSVKRFQILLFKTNNSVEHYSFISSQLN